uniref:Putative ovule protein n=1 Tax=Solanum chacoense TaxID=4108 RepID=A0A0V0GUL2_SOLCH
MNSTIGTEEQSSKFVSNNELYSMLMHFLFVFLGEGVNFMRYTLCSNLEVDLGSEENAHIVYTALVVDKELQPDKVKRHMSVSNGKLSVNFEAVEARFLRASFSAFVDVLTLTTKTIEEFGPKKE